jgi:hypothetical protein
MYDINLKNVKKEKNIYRIFLYIGIIILLIIDSIVLASKLKLRTLDSYAITRNIEIVSHIDDDGDEMYTPVYHYNVNDESYECKSGVSSSNRPTIKKGKVYYDSKNPSRCMTDYSIKANKILIILNIIPLTSIGIGLFFINKVNNKIKRIKKLNETGKLVKGLPYHMENSNITVNGSSILKIAIEYQLPSGETKTLYGEPRFDRKHSDSDNLVDLLIDENDPDNYFIDFEINRSSGNRPEDYYDKKM